MKKCPLAILPLYLLIISCGPPQEERDAANALDKLRANELIAAGDFEEAASILRPLAADNPRDPQVLSMLGETLWRLDDFSAALENFEASLRIDYSDHRTHMLLALLLMENGRTGRALTEFKLAAQFGAHDALAHYNYGLALYELERKGEAVEQWRMAYELEPDNPKYVAAMGIGYSGEDDWEALAYFEKAASLGADSHSFHHNFGLLLERLGELKRAREQFHMALKGSPNNETYEFSLAGLYMKTGAFEKAVELWQALLQKVPQKRAHRIYLAKAFLELERYREAVTTLEMDTAKWEKEDAAGFAGGSSDIAGLDQAFDILAMSCRGTGELERGLEYIRKAVRLVPANVTHLINYGVLLAENGKIDEAVDQWRKALRLDPENAIAKKNLSAYSR